MTVVEGVKIQIKSDELAKMLVERAEFHRERHKRYVTRIEAMNKVIGAEQKLHEEDDEDDDQPRGMSTGYATKATWSNKADSAIQRAAYFQLMAKHVIPNVIYQLTQRDITELELASRYL